MLDSWHNMGNKKQFKFSVIGVVIYLIGFYLLDINPSFTNMVNNIAIYVVFIILGLTVAMVLFWIGLAKQRDGEVLTIFKDNDKIELLLTDDNYLTIDILDISSDKNQIEARLKEVIENRAFELKGLVTKIRLVHIDDEILKEELLGIIEN